MKALVVDDSINDRRLLSKLLKIAGFEVLEACNGIEALENAGKETPDIIISDVMMPEMDGFMLLRNLKKDSKTKVIPFIFYTATYSSEEDKELGLSLGASRYLIKPVEPVEIIAHIKAVIKEFKAMKIPPHEPEITDIESLEKYVQRISLKLESKIKKLEEEIEKRKNVEESLETYMSHQAILIELSQLVLSDATIPMLMNHVVGLTGKTLGVEYCKILELLPDSKSLLMRAGVGWKKELVDCATVDAGKGSHAGFTLISNEAVILEDARTEKRFELSPLLKDLGIISGLSVIIMARGKPFGILEVHTTKLRKFSEDDINYLQNVANMLSMAIERRKVEEALRESEEKYRDLYEEAPNAYYSVGKDGRIIRANRRAAQMTGFAIDELIGKKVFELYENTPPGTAKAREVFNRFIKGEEIIGEELKVQKKDGSSLWVALSVRPVKDADGNVIASRSIAVDINERKQAENLRLEKERLEYASKAKSEFLASMSHELRTPLNAVLGFSELMKQGIAGKLNEKQEHYIENIISSGKFLLNLINDILDLSKVEAGKIELVMERISLPMIMDETISLIKERAARRNVNIRKELSPELEFIEVDKQRFKQVMFNLLDNAIKFSRPQGGIVTITTKKAGDNVEISVSDKGIGIKPEDIGKLFQKFQQINPEISGKYGGTGLGLAICKQIVELHGGRIMADSKYGEGSRFTFIFPLKGIKAVNK